MSDTALRTIHVTGLSPTSTEPSIRRFFSFCGEIESLKYETSTASADIVFAKTGAAKTASFLNGGSLDGKTLDVKWVGEGKADSATAVAEPAFQSGDDVRQEDKPRSAVAAEYLASGYELSDQVVAKAIELDNQHGLSSRFMAFWQPLSEAALNKMKEVDERHGISAQTNQKVKSTDEKYKISDKAASAQSIGLAYYERMLNSSLGTQVSQFYGNTSKQIQDVHAEARRIADSKKPALPTATSSAAPTSATTASQTTTAPPATSGPNVTQAPVTNPT